MMEHPNGCMWNLARHNVDSARLEIYVRKVEGDSKAKVKNVLYFLCFIVSYMRVI